MSDAFDRRDASILVAAFAWSLLHAFHFDHTADDAFISFRYVDNFVSGHGLVFNPGEYVMGYSNFLWVMLLSALEVLGIPPPSGARLLGSLFAWATLARVYLFLAGRGGSRAPAIAALALLVANGTFALWMFGGLEGQLLAFLLASGVIDAMRLEPDAGSAPYLRLGATFGLAAVTRPEAIAYALPVGSLLLLRHFDARRARGVATFWATAGAIYLALVAWAWSYYGDPLPNPYYAKRHALSLELIARGWAFTRTFGEAYALLPLLIPTLWCVSVRLRRSAEGWLPLSVIATFALFFLCIGGDALVYFRMWLPMLPLFALLLGEALAEWTRRGVRHAHGAALAAAVAVVALSLPNSLFGRNIAYLRRDDALLRDIALLARSLREREPDATLAANNVGVLAYESGLPVIDMLGINDRHVARAPGKKLGIPGHESHDGAYVLDREPDLIFLGVPQFFDEPGDAERVVIGYPSDRDLVGDPRFQEHYRLDHVRLEDGRYAPVFRRFDRREAP